MRIRAKRNSGEYSVRKERGKEEAHITPFPKSNQQSRDGICVYPTRDFPQV
jgi:hypothetical protein